MTKLNRIKNIRCSVQVVTLGGYAVAPVSQVEDGDSAETEAIQYERLILRKGGQFGFATEEIGLLEERIGLQLIPVALVVFVPVGGNFLVERFSGVRSLGADSCVVFVTLQGELSSHQVIVAFGYKLPQHLFIGRYIPEQVLQQGNIFRQDPLHLPLAALSFLRKDICNSIFLKQIPTFDSLQLTSTQAGTLRQQHRRRQLIQGRVFVPIRLCPATGILAGRTTGLANLLHRDEKDFAQRRQIIMDRRGTLPF